MKHLMAVVFVFMAANTMPVFAGGDYYAEIPGSETAEKSAQKKLEESAAFSPNEPMVTQEESEAIAQALNLYSQDKHEGIEFLAAQITPASSSALDFTLGTLYFRDEHLEKAAQSYRKALKKLPTFTRARSNLARIYLRLDQKEEALKEFHQVLLEGAREPSTLTLIGYIHMTQEEAVPAENAYRQAILLDPDDEQAYYGLAKSLLIQERYAEVIQLLNQMIEANPGRSNLWSLLSNAYLSSEKPFDAIKTLEAAKYLGAASSEAVATLGDLYLHEQMAEEALKAYKAAMADGQLSHSRILRAVEGFVLIESPDQARELIAQQAAGNQDVWTEEALIKLMWLKARVEHLSGNYAKAEMLYQTVLDHKPLHGLSLVYLGDLYQQQGDLEKALITFEQAQNISGFWKQSLLRQAQLEVQRQRYEEAVVILEDVLVDDFQPHVARYLEQVRRLVN